MPRPGSLCIFATILASLYASIAHSTDSDSTASTPTDLLEFEETIVWGQIISAQAKALKDQQTAPNIKNVTSSELFTRFPDRNAAETLQRLPGIAIDRDQGEGEFVQVRGMGSQLNSVTVNGRRIPSPTANINEGRAVGLDMLQSNSIATIEVIKALTPDLDADALGGAVNLVLKQAPEVPHYSIALASGVADKASPLKSEWGSEIADLSFTAGRRVHSGRLGLIAGANFYRTNIGSELVELDYTGPGSDSLLVNERDNYDIRRHRLGLLLGADYRFDEQRTLRFDLTWNRFLDDEIRRRRSFLPAEALEEMEVRNRREDQQFYMASLAGEGGLGSAALDFGLSFAESREELPDRTYLLFERENLYLDPRGMPLDNQALRELDFATHFDDLGAFRLVRNRFDRDLSQERDLSAWLNAELPLATHAVKLGVKAVLKDRTSKDRRREYKPNDGLTTSEGDFILLDVKYDDPSLTALYPLAKYGSVPQFLNYEAAENVYAAYAMTTFNWSSAWTLLTGIRGEFTAHDYSHQTTPESSDDNYYNILPSLHLTRRLGDRANLRLALTSGLARPEYTRLLPWQALFDGEILVGNPDLVTTKSYGVDLMLEAFPGTLGLFSAGLFAKRLYDPITIETTRRNLGETGINVIKPINGDKGRVLGGELALMRKLSQQRDSWLGNTGIYANYTYSFTESDYGNARPQDGPLLGNARHTTNAGLFYDRSPRSVTLSGNYRSAMLREVAEDPREDKWFDTEFHLDFSASQRLTPHLTVALKLNNLTNQSEREILGHQTASPRLHERESYGRSGTLGFDYIF
jgi:TonB-dependent receptor